MVHTQERADDVIATSHGRFCLEKHELFWTALQPHLQEFGYKLRARYEPGWRCAEPEHEEVDGILPRDDYHDFAHLNSRIARRYFDRHPEDEPLLVRPAVVFT